MNGFFLHLFIVAPVCQYLLKPNPRFTKRQGFLYAVAFLSLIAAFSVYSEIKSQPPNYFQVSLV